MMECKEIDFLQYIEGQAPNEAVTHIENCWKCKNESERMSKFSKLITVRYVKGKKIEGELDEKLQSIDSSKMKKLPENLQKKISELKEKSLVSRLTGILEKKKNACKLAEDVLTPYSYAVAASPKDITKAKDSKKKRKK